MTMIPNRTAATQIPKQTTAPARPAADGLVISSPAGPTLTSWRLLLRERTPRANRAGSPAPSSRPTSRTCQSASRDLVKISMTLPSARSLGRLAFGSRRQPAFPFGIDVFRSDGRTTGPAIHKRSAKHQGAEDDGDTEGAANAIRHEPAHGADDACTGQREHPGDDHAAEYAPTHRDPSADP